MPAKYHAIKANQKLHSEWETEFKFVKVKYYETGKFHEERDMIGAEAIFVGRKSNKFQFSLQEKLF